MKPNTSTSYSSTFRETPVSPFFLVAFILFVTLFYYTDFNYICQLQYRCDNGYHISTNHTIAFATDDEKRRVKLPFAMGEGNKVCDIFEGKWIRDHTQPAYEEWDCPYLERQTTCLKNGRPEKEYRYWSWQPEGCSIPRFNATLMLEGLRGKRMMFVGDSLNRGQFFSMICLLLRAIPKHSHSIDVFDSLTVFAVKDYNVTIEFYWAPFLLESNADDPFHHHVTDRIILNSSMDDGHGRHWEGADILVFNTYIWWITRLRVLRSGSFEDKVKDIVEIGREEGYRMAMKSLIQWLERHINVNKKRVFFITMSPTHQWSYKWGGDAKGNCYNETRMIHNTTYFAAEESIMNITAEEIGGSQVPITILNITHLSSARKDAHVSVYKPQRPPLTQENHADCIHWCLPGLPDIWNQLLFIKLFYP